MKIHRALLLIMVASAAVRAQVASLPLSQDEIRSLIASGKRADAEKAIVKELVERPANADLITLLAEVRLEQGHPDEALRLTENAEQIGGASALRSQIRGLANGASGHLENAETDFRRAIALDPQFVPAHYYLARLLYTRNHFDSAIEESKATIALSPDFVRAYENLGLCYEGEDDAVQAEQWYRRAILKNSETQTKTEWPMLDLATLLIRQDRGNEALPYLKEALAVNPNNPESHLQMGILLQKRGDLEGSIDELHAAIGIDPDLAGALYHLAQVLKRLGRKEEAQHYFDNYKRTLEKKR